MTSWRQFADYWDRKNVNGDWKEIIIIIIIIIITIIIVIIIVIIVIGFRVDIIIPMLNFFSIIFLKMYSLLIFFLFYCILSLSFDLSIYLFIYLSIFLFIFLFLSIQLSTYLANYLYEWINISPSISIFFLFQRSNERSLDHYEIQWNTRNGNLLDLRYV